TGLVSCRLSLTHPSSFVLAQPGLAAVSCAAVLSYNSPLHATSNLPSFIKNGPCSERPKVIRNLPTSTRFSVYPMQPSTIHRARWAIALTFLAHGFVVGSWIPHIPPVKDRLDVGTGVFGLALLAIGAGAIVAMPLSGVLINRFGSARVTMMTGIAFCFAFILPPMAPQLWSFLPAGLLFGATIGGMDVAMNAHGIAIEKALRQARRSLLPAAFSVGAMAGSLIGAALLRVMSESSHV